jgi:hypothetical protein
LRISHWPVVETKYCFDHAVKFVRQIYGANPSAIRAAGVLESLQVHTERIIELCHCPRQDHGSPPGMFLHDREPMSAGKLADCGDIASVGTKLALKFLTAQMARALRSGRKLVNPLRQRG